MERRNQKEKRRIKMMDKEEFEIEIDESKRILDLMYIAM